MSENLTNLKKAQEILDASYSDASRLTNGRFVSTSREMSKWMMLIADGYIALEQVKIAREAAIHLGRVQLAIRSLANATAGYKP